MAIRRRMQIEYVQMGVSYLLPLLQRGARARAAQRLRVARRRRCTPARPRAPWLDAARRAVRVGCDARMLLGLQQHGEPAPLAQWRAPLQLHRAVHDVKGPGEVEPPVSAQAPS